MLPKVPAANESANQPRTFWDTVLTTTPVVMTVLATILAGLSSSEMTRAQYDRSMAAQFQSKAGDQWAFFQAKRTRSTVIGQDLDLYPGRPVRIDAGRLRAALSGVAETLQTSEGQAEQVRQAAAKAAGGHEAGSAPGGVLSGLPERARDLAAEAQQALGAVSEQLGQGQVAKALAFLGTERLPHEEQADRRITDPALADALKALRERKPEDEVWPLVRRLNEDQLREAMAVAESNSKAFEDDSAWVDDALRGVDRAVARMESLAHAFQRLAGEVRAAVDDLPAGAKDQDGLRGAVAAWTRTDHAVQRHRATLADYRAGRKDYTARRNHREAGYNLQAAWPYELRVVKSSVSSERHRQRSLWFFCAMLGAQAATATASLALAARQKSTLWGLAGLVGLAALGFSVYIYLYF